MELAEAQDRIEELERQLEEAKAKVEQENAPSL
jgi:Tfp pilus assembly protein FimV